MENENEKNHKLAYFYIVLVIFLWSTTPAATKLLVTDLGTIHLLFFTMFAASTTLFSITLYKNKFKTLKAYLQDNAKFFAFMGGLGIFFYDLCYYRAYSLMTAQETNIVNYLWPIFVMIFASIILKETLTVQKIVGIVLSFFGVYYVITHGDIYSFKISNIQGVFFAATGAVSYGLFSALGKKYHYDKLVSMTLYFSFSFLFITIVTLFTSLPPVISLKQILGIIWLGGIATGCGFLFWFQALHYGHTEKITNLVYLTPFFSLVFIHLLVGETILSSSVIGLVLIVSGIGVQFIKLKNRKQE